jgi:hypothetical protein
MGEPSGWQLASVSVAEACERYRKRNKKGAIKPGFEGVRERILPWK